MPLVVSWEGQNYELFDEVYETITQGYYHEEDIDLEKMKTRALKSFVMALGDPFSSYMDDEEYTFLMEWLSWSEEFAGIGAVVMKHEDGLMIEQVLKQSPAAQAGLKPFDIVVEINGTGVVSESLMESVERIRGPEGTNVTLTIIRLDNGVSDIFTVEIQRAKLVNESVWTHEISTGGYNLLHIEIMEVGEQTDSILRQKIAWIDMKHIDGVILDLRGNAGGFLIEGIDIASHFIPRWLDVVKTSYRSFRDDVFKSKWYGSFDSLPVVILIDEMTASASEIIALALREQRGSLIVGKESFGKWTIQSLYPFEHGSLKLTVGKRFSPQGVWVWSWGIVPDEIVDFDIDLYKSKLFDTQLDKAIWVLLKQLIK